jgi:hypothetical protein
MWLRILIIVVLAPAAIYAVAYAYGAVRWAAQTRALRRRLDSARAPVQQQTVDFSELAGLPEPVQRYFRAVLTDGQPIVTGVTVQHAGTFNRSTPAEQWQPFTSDQWVVTARPGFVWNGRVVVLER